MVISLDSLDSVSMYNDTIQSKNLLPNYSASSLTLVGRYTVDLSLYMDTLSRLITIQSKNLLPGS
jgi:hypothetical protein